MEKNNHTVFQAKDLSDILYHLSTVSNLQLVAGGSAIDHIEEKSVSLKYIPELKLYDKRERYLDIGAGMTLSEVAALGKENLGKLLYDAIISIGTENVRNLATIGGNICAKDCIHTLWAPLWALEARLEFKSTKDSKTIPFSKFDGVPEGYVLTKIRIPVDEWELAIFMRVGTSHEVSKESGSFAFLADSQKGILSSVRIAFAGPFKFRSNDLENKLIGTRLPLSSKFINQIMEESEKIFNKETEGQEIKEITKSQFLNLLRMSLLELT